MAKKVSYKLQISREICKLMINDAHVCWDSLHACRLAQNKPDARNLEIDVPGNPLSSPYSLFTIFSADTYSL
jgi:hypothetical protein